VSPLHLGIVSCVAVLISGKVIFDHFRIWKQLTNVDLKVAMLEKKVAAMQTLIDTASQLQQTNADHVFFLTSLNGMIFFGLEILIFACIFLAFRRKIPANLTQRKI
jgi:hypothetical protein